MNDYKDSDNQWQISAYEQYAASRRPAVSTQPDEAKPQEPPFERRDNIFVLLSFIICFAFCEFILFGGFGIGVPVFFAVFYPFAIAMLTHRNSISKKHVFNRSAVLSFIPVVILLICFTLFDNSVMRFFNVIALFLCTMFNLICMAELGGSPIFWAGVWLDILKTTFYTPFHNIGKRIAAFCGTFRSEARRKIFTVLLTLLIVSPVLVFVLIMLANSDAGFEAILSRFGTVFTKQFWEYFWKVILSILFTFPLFNLLYSMRYQKRSKKHPIDGMILKLGCLNTLSTASALTAFSFIYVIYIGLQANYFFSAILGVLPPSFTYAGYARRGFFELVTVVFVNFCLIALAVTMTKRKDGKITNSCRISSVFLIACTLLLVVTAASKMVMYMGTYGLTPLRVYTSWFMLLLGVLSLFMMLKMILPKFDFYRFCAVGTISLYLALNLVNVDGLIAHYNISLYRQSGKLDTSVLYGLSDSANSEIAALIGDAHYGDEITKMLDTRKKLTSSSRWQDLTIPQIIESK